MDKIASPIKTPAAISFKISSFFKMSSDHRFGQILFPVLRITHFDVEGGKRKVKNTSFFHTAFISILFDL